MAESSPRHPGRRKAWRIARWLLIGLGLLIVVPLALVHLALLTRPVRDFVKDKVSTVASGALGGGKLEIDRLDALSIAHLRAAGIRVLGKRGERLASVDHVAVYLNPLTLAWQRLTIVSLEITRPWADLGAPLDEGGGLLGLFQDEAKPPPASEKTQPSAFDVALRKLAVKQGRVDVRAGGAQWRIQDFNTLLSVQLGSELALRVTRLASSVLRDERVVASIGGNDLGYAGTGSARAQLEIRAGQSKLSANAQLEPPDATGAQPLHAELHARAISAETLASFGLDASVLTAPVNLDARADGTTRAFAWAAQLGTPGGRVDVDGRMQAPHLTATLRTQRLEPERFLSAQIAPVTALLELRAERDPAADADKLDLLLTRSSYGGVPLPHVQARAHRNAAGTIWLDSLDARYPQASLNAKGRLEQSGQLWLQAKLAADSLAEVPAVKHLGLPLHGVLHCDLDLSRSASGSFSGKSDLRLTKFRYDELQAAAVQWHLDAHGPAFDRPSLAFGLHATGLQNARTRLPRADITVAGGPEQYVIAGRFADRGGLGARVTHTGRRISVQGQASVVIDNAGARRPLRARIGHVEYEPDRAILLRDIELSYRNARASIDGVLDPRKNSRLRASIEVPEVAELTGLWMTRPIKGSLSASAGVDGSSKQPRLQADARFRTTALYGLKNLAVDLHTRADVAKKHVELRVETRSHAGAIEVALQTDLRWPNASAAAFMDGRHRLAIEIDRFRPSELIYWPRDTLVPIEAVISGEVGARGRLADIEVTSDLRAGLKFGGDAGTLDLALQGKYAREQVELVFDGRDQRGPLLSTRIQTELKRKHFSNHPDFMQRLLRERSWEASAKLSARRLDQLPVVRALQLPEAALPVQVSAEFDLKHSPGQEPDGKLSMHAGWEAPGNQVAKHRIEGATPLVERCGVSYRPAIEFEARMRAGELHSQLVASVGGKEALSMKTESHAPIDEWFRSQPGQIRPAGVAVTFSDLRLSQLPMVCEFVDGRISGHAEISRALTREVSASIDVHGTALRVRDAPPLDAVISATGNRQILNTLVNLQAANGSAKITANLPLDPLGRMPSLKLDGPAYLEAKIRNMDVRSLLGPVPNVRATQGKLDAELALTGTMLKPFLRGKIEVRNATVTLAELGQRVERVSGMVKLEGRTARVERLKVHDRDGTAELTGQLTMREFGSFKGEVQVKADDFPLRKTGTMLARFDGRAKLSADIDPKRTRFDLTLHRARIELSDEDMSGVQSLRPNRDIVFADAGQHELEQLATATASTPLIFNIDASEPFWVTRSDFSVLVSTKLKVEAAEGPVSVTGAVDITRGYIELIGQMFDIEHGHIEFTGGHEVEPTLDLTATRRVPGGKKVSIKASGTLRAPELAFFVDDAAVTAGEALATASGSRSSGSGSTVQQQMSSMATGLAAGVLTLGARREIGEWMPVLSIDAGEHGPSVRAGIEADRFIPGFLRKIVVDAYVEGILTSEESEGSRGQSSGGPAQPAALLELRFPHSLVGEAQYGPGERWSVDVGWEP